MNDSLAQIVPPVAVAAAPTDDMLYSAARIGQLDLRNRVVMSPMSRYRSPGNVPNDDNLAYYLRRARAGVGLIVSEGTFVDHPAAAAYEWVPHFFGAEALAGWRRIADAVHDAGAKMMPQLWHVGAVRRLGLPPDPEVPGFGPVEIVEERRRLVVAMGQGDIDAVVASFARGAAAAREAGFDGVAIHGGHGYLIDQFLWRGTNDRNDRYGGTIENRARLACEIVAAMRREVGADFPIVLRISQWKAKDYEARIADDPDELAVLVRLLVEAGVDVFDVSTRRFWQPAFEGDPRSLAAWVRALSGRPVIAVGSIGLDQPHQSKYYRTADNVAANVTDLAMVHEGLARGDFDLAAVGRALLADPAWVEKTRRGAFDAVVPFTRSAMDEYR